MIIYWPFDVLFVCASLSLVLRKSFYLTSVARQVRLSSLAIIFCDSDMAILECLILRIKGLDFLNIIS